MSGIRLVVQADDLGMCRAVNEGIGLAVTDGIVTQTSVMAPTPWFAEGAAVARRVGVVTGLHATFTCEWDYLRWAPLSTGASLRLKDGTMPRTVDDATTLIDPGEGLAELRAQATRARGLGLELAYVDCHMGISVTTAYAGVCGDLGVPFLYPGVDPHLTFDSVSMLSTVSTDDLAARPARFAGWLDRLGEGTHLVVTHPAVASEELRAVCDPEADNAMWAETWRVADLAAVTAPEVRAVIERRGIDLISVADLSS